MPEFAVGRAPEQLVHPTVEQRSLQVGRADDPAEREAEATSERVVAWIRSRAGHDGVARPLRTSTSRIRRNTTTSVAPEIGAAGGDVSPELSQRIRRRGAGQPLDDTTRSRFEPAFGTSFAEVRVHTDSDVAPRVGARAFTLGTDVHFAAGQYRPDTTDGARTLAHELTHVVQQTGRVQRASSPHDGPAPAQTRIRAMPDSSPTIRRVISDDQWTNVVTPKVDRGLTVTVWKGATAVVIRKDGDVLKFKPAVAPKFANLTDALLLNVKAQCSLTPEHLGKDATFTAKPTVGQGFTVTEFANERLSLVHHTESSGEDKNPHLTVENAHVLAIEDLFNSTTRDVREKSNLNKATINQALSTFGVGSVDNLNFYQPEKPKKNARKPAKGEDAHSQLPLSRYLAFLAHALTVGGAPQEYGERIIAFADRMAEDKKLETSQLFMRVGMDEPAFVRAVLIIDSQLPATSKLAISDPTRKVFAKWWNVADNEGKVPYLPAPDDKTGDAVVRSGNPYKSESFSVIEVRYCQEHFGEFVAAINTFTPTPAVIADATPNKKGKRNKT